MSSEVPALPIDPNVITQYHDPLDQDSGIDAGHHSLGTSPDQAAPGNHRHLTGFTITGAKGGSAILTSIVNALVQLGATDGTT